MTDSTPRAWKGILIHHSATPDGPLVDTDAIDRYHRDVRGWNGIGYHWCVEQDGGTYIPVQGRDESLPGAHCPGRNDLDLGVCLIGDFTKYPPPFEQLKVATRLCADLCRKYGFSHNAIRPHRTFRQTECPGLAFSDAHLYALRQEVHRLVRCEVLQHE